MNEKDEEKKISQKIILKSKFKFFPRGLAEKKILTIFKFQWMAMIVAGKEYFRNSIVVWLVILSLFFNMANWGALKILIKPVDLPIILHYNVYFGVDVMGNWKGSFFSPILGLLLFLINFSLAFFFYKNKERIASYVLLIGGLMIQLGMLVYSISLIIINY